MRMSRSPSSGYEAEIHDRCNHARNDDEEENIGKPFSEAALLMQPFIAIVPHLQHPLLPAQMLLHQPRAGVKDRAQFAAYAGGSVRIVRNVPSPIGFQKRYGSIVLPYETCSAFQRVRGGGGCGGEGECRRF